MWADIGKVKKARERLQQFEYYVSSVCVTEVFKEEYACLLMQFENKLFVNTVCNLPFLFWEGFIPSLWSDL